MKLALKLVAVLILEIILLLAIDGYLAVKREIKLFDTEMKREALQIGYALKDLVVEVMAYERPTPGHEINQGCQ